MALYEFSMLIGDQSKLKKMVESRAALIPFYQQLRLRLAGVATRWPEHLLIHSQLAWMDHGLANLLREQERLDEARAFFESSLANWDKVVSAAPEHPGWSSHRLITLEAFALLIVEQGRLAIEDGKIEQGAGYLAQAVAEYELRNLQPSAYTVIGLVDCRWKLAVLLARRGEHGRARALFEESLANWDRVVSADPQNSEWCSRRLSVLEVFASSAVEQGRIAIEQGKTEEGAGYLAQAVTQCELRNFQPSVHTAAARWRTAVGSSPNCWLVGASANKPGRCSKSRWRTGTRLFRRLLRILHCALTGSACSRYSPPRPLSKGG